MKKAFAVLSALVAILSARAVTVSNVMLSYDAATEKMTVSYHVDAPAIVTLSASLAGEPLAPAQIDALTALANRRVAAGANAVVWDLRAAFPEQRFSASQLKVSVTAWPVDNGPNYMSIDLVNASTVRYYESVDALPEPISSDRWRTTEMLFRKIPAKGVTCRMGAPSGEVGRKDNSELVHYVKFTSNYYLGVFECTQKQFMLIFGSNPSKFKSGAESVWGTRPVEEVHFSYWDDRSKTEQTYLRDPDTWPNENEVAAHSVTAERSFIYKMRAHSGLNYCLDLPSYSQWEFACRAGCSAPLYNGEALVLGENPIGTTLTEQHAELDGISRYYYNSSAGTVDNTESTGLAGTARVGSYEPNAWGLYDMLGNVSEVCLDRWSFVTASTMASPHVDYQGPENDSWGNIYNGHVCCGGSWNTKSGQLGLRCAAHAAMKFASGENSQGFRMCLTLKEEN